MIFVFCQNVPGPAQLTSPLQQLGVRHMAQSTRAHVHTDYQQPYSASYHSTHKTHFILDEPDSIHDSARDVPHVNSNLSSNSSTSNPHTDKIAQKPQPCSNTLTNYIKLLEFEGSGRIRNDQGNIDFNGRGRIEFDGYTKCTPLIDITGCNNINGARHNMQGRTDIPETGKNVAGMDKNMPGVGNNIPGNGNNIPGMGNNVPGMGNIVPDTGNNMHRGSIENVDEEVHVFSEGDNVYSETSSPFSPRTTTTARARSVSPSSYDTLCSIHCNRKDGTLTNRRKQSTKTKIEVTQM